MSGIRHPDGSKSVVNWKNNNYVMICRHGVIVNFLFDVFVFLLCSLVTGPSFMLKFKKKLKVLNCIEFQRFLTVGEVCNILNKYQHLCNSAKYYQFYTRDLTFLLHFQARHRTVFQKYPLFTFNNIFTSFNSG